jgi:V/A-type H+-transporting ATPase subunit I
LLLVFLSLFFGILIGDAGYGIVYLGLTAWFQKKKGRVPAVKQACLLMYVFSSCAVIWGVLTGTFFGQAWLKQRGIFGLDPALNDPRFMQTVCFMLGALHLSIAHGWRAVRKLPSLSALSDIGWICILWTAFFLAKALILGDAFPWEGKLLLISGLLLVVLFASPQRNVLKAIGSGLGTIALSLVNNFTDVVSYVRLFAVGLAGVAIAEATNAMAAGFGSGFLAAAAGVLVIVFGHALNIVLGPMSVLVHGVRLNVLEFSSHASVTWSGIAYAPLKE